MLYCYNSFNTWTLKHHYDNKLYWLNLYISTSFMYFVMSSTISIYFIFSGDWCFFHAYVDVECEDWCRCLMHIFRWIVFFKCFYTLQFEVGVAICHLEEIFKRKIKQHNWRFWIWFVMHVLFQRPMVVFYDKKSNET